MAFRKSNRRVRKQRKQSNRRKVLKRSAPRLYKAVKAIAKSEALKAQETKYTTQIVALNAQITNSLNSILNPGIYNYLQAAIPPLQAGTTYSEIVGAKMTLISGYTKFHFTLNYDNTATQELIVKLFCLTSKQARSYPQATTLSGKDLLRQSNYQQDWLPSIADPRVSAQLSLNDLAWNGHIHTFKLSKNGGGMNGDKTPGVAPPANIANHPSYHEFKWNWSSGARTLKYDTPGPPLAAQLQYPTNYMPLWGVCVYYPDGTPIGEDNSVQPVRMVVTNHMWYKDA